MYWCLFQRLGIAPTLRANVRVELEYKQVSFYVSCFVGYF